LFGVEFKVHAGRPHSQTIVQISAEHAQGADGQIPCSRNCPSCLPSKFRAIDNQLDQKGDLMREIRICCLGAVLTAALAATACSDGTLRSPAGPSSLTAAPEGTVAAPAVDRSSVVSAGVAADWAVNRGWSTAADGLMVEGSDVITAVDGNCPDRVITVRGVPVTINSGTMLGPGVTCDALAVGMTVHIAGLLTVTNGTYSVIATSVGGDQQPTEGGGTGGGGTGSPGHRGHVAGEGTVANLAGACPTLAMVVRGTRVHTDVDTEFVNGACGNLRNGTKVEVDGDTNPDGSLHATRLKIVDQPGGGGQGRTSGEGTVAAVRGTCPSLTMVIRGYAVMTSSATTYVSGHCADLRPGAKVLVTGVNQANSLLAETVEFKE
jgi:uncharacterized protein DUF5666